MNLDVWTTHKPSPARALDTESRGSELSLEVLERTEGLDDGILEWTVTEDTASALALGGGRREILPEERVVDMSWKRIKMSARMKLQNTKSAYGEARLWMMITIVPMPKVALVR